MTDRELQRLLKHLKELDDLDRKSKIMNMMKDLILKNKRMKIEEKLKYLILYAQYKQEEAKQINDNATIILSIIERIERLFD